jgi:hypothetical protein
VYEWRGITREWRGITRAAQSLCDSKAVRWLYFGCDLGGLVRYAPLEPMRQTASLPKPGGVFSVTTGNAAPHRGSFARWKYVHPDIHVAYFQPRALSETYRRVGLEPLAAGFLPGHEDIIRYKVLRTLHGTSRNPPERLVPWSVASRVIDRRCKVSSRLSRASRTA